MPGDNSAGHPHVEWLSDPAVLAPLALMAGIYVWRFRQARRDAGGRGAGPLQAAAFAGAMIALLAALVSPIDGLGEDYLFSAHMVQHVLLGDIAPLLLLLALSRVIMRPATRRLTGIERALGPLASPVAAIALWLGLMYLWHVPALYDAAVEHAPVHLLEHVSFFAAGIALWWPLIQPVPMRRRLTGLQPLAYIGAAKAGLAALGLYLAWSTTVLYPYYEQTPRIWGLSPIEDQNVGGVIMMVEQSLTLVMVMVVLFVGMLGRSEEEQRRKERLEQAEEARANVGGAAGA
ncbi:MAG TPA: cytochrome c oxidase assembly protein [Thermoleophilaceae bacterium]|nr:cytochrome c oxidase assembly protein [Thermoleophilaceae bacterium]